MVRHHQCACRADRRMTSERQLTARSEDSDSPCMGRIARRQHEGRFRIIEFPCNRLHCLRRKPAGIGEDRELVAAERPVGEDVESYEIVAHWFPLLVRVQARTRSSISIAAPSGSAATATVVRAGNGGSN